MTRESMAKGQAGDEEAPAPVWAVPPFSSDTSKVAFGKSHDKQKAKTESQENGRVAKPFPWSR